MHLHQRQILPATIGKMHEEIYSHRCDAEGCLKQTLSDNNEHVYFWKKKTTLLQINGEETYIVQNWCTCNPKGVLTTPRQNACTLCTTWVEYSRICRVQRVNFRKYVIFCKISVTLVYKNFNRNSEHVPQFLQEYTLITYFTSLIRRDFQFFFLLFFLDF